MASSSNNLVAQTLVDVEAFRDLPAPVVLTSGELGIYYINTEKLAQDDGKWADYAEDSQAMINHCVGMAASKKSFGEVISVMAEKVNSLFPTEVATENRLISGGQRRDWLFSGPIARELGLAHCSLHKDRSMYLLSADGTSLTEIGNSADALQGKYCVHVVDLLTKGSSAYNPNVSPASGWIVELRKRGAEIKDLVSVVDRLQGAENILKEVDVDVFAFVKIDRDFIEGYSSDKDRALAYMKDPVEWGHKYISENGVEAFAEVFEANSGKQDRAKKFVDVFHSVLAETGLLKELQEKLEA